MQNFGGGHEEYDFARPTGLDGGGGRNLPNVPGSRPKVDPEAAGEVDPNLYPQPKDATEKIRGRSDLLEYLFGTVDQELLTVKTFYFFFYSAFGSLFPLMGVYFKQMGMNAGQGGLLIGLRPFIEFFSAPFWGSLADRSQKGKTMLLASLSCWIIFTLPLGFVQPPGTSCMIRNDSGYYLLTPKTEQRIVKRSINRDEMYYKPGPEDTEYLEVAENVVFERYRRSDTSETFDAAKFLKYNPESASAVNNKRASRDVAEESKKKADKSKKKASEFQLKDKLTKSLSKREAVEVQENSLETLNFEDDAIEVEAMREADERRANEEEFGHYLSRSRRSTGGIPRSYAGQSPRGVYYAVNYKQDEESDWVKPLFSSIVYRLPDIQKTFFLLLLLVIVGEFFAAPAITLADSAVITLLGEDADRYGHQRMFGSLGWGLAMFFVGIALDHSTAFPDHPCGPDPREKNYTICFAIFSVLMGAALITATQINFKYEPPIAEPEVEKPPAEPTREEQLQNQLSQQLNLPSLQDSSAAPAPPPPPEQKTKIWAQTTREIPEWVTVMKQFKDLKCASFLFVAWFMGFGIGLIFTFLFWHLQDYGGSPTLFGVASVINHISEIFAYFFSFKLIRQMGHVKVLCLGLGGNVLRFLYISWLTNPWWVLPFEFIQGITHAAVWAACCSYIAHNTPPQLRSSAQGVLQGLHHGLGRGCGAVIGGMFVAIYGTTTTFRAYGLICALVLAGFIFINFYRKDTGFVSDLPQTEDPHQVAEATHLAPHGVPSNAIPRALSSSRLHELANQDPGYGATYQTSSGNLGVPGANGAPVNPNNPFLNPSGGGGYNNYSVSGKGDDEYIRRSFQMFSEVVGWDFEVAKPPPVVTRLHAQQPCTNPFHQHDYDW